jgi:hypothetical protein
MSLADLYRDMQHQIDAATRPLGLWAPLPAALTGEPLLFRFMDALALVELTGDRSRDLDTLTDASERFGATLDLDRRVWWSAASGAVSLTIQRWEQR